MFVADRLSEKSKCREFRCLAAPQKNSMGVAAPKTTFLEVWGLPASDGTIGMSLRRRIRVANRRARSYTAPI